MRSQKGYAFEEESYRIIGACLRVHKELGPGFRELIYQRALELEFTASEIEFAREEWISIHYRGQVVGKQRMDFIACNILLEIKAIQELLPVHYIQATSYLKASGCPLGLLLNFGRPKLEIHRLLWDGKTPKTTAMSG